jgi:hypothetical protein
MTSSSFRQPLSPSLAARLATGYGPSLAPGAFEWDLEGPAGALSSTAADMARFMIAHLGKGRLGAVHILREETAEAMQRRQFANHPAVSGLTYGFQELNLAGQRVLVQPGDMLYFTAALFLLPEQDLGLFVAYNRGRASEAPMELLRAFLARLDPLGPWFDPGPPAPWSDGDLSRFTGTYRSTRRNESTLEKLQELFSPVRVRAVAPGILGVSGLAVVPRALWVQTEPGVFRDRASPQLIAFREDGAGHATHLFEDNFPSAGYSRVPWYGVPGLHYAVLSVGALLFSLTPIVWSMSALRRPGAGSLLARRARRIAGTLCVVNLLFLAGMVLVLARGQELLYGVTPFARAVLVLPLISAGLTGLTLVLALIALRRRFWSPAGRLHYLIVGLVGLAFLASLRYWNLLDLQF